MTEPQLDIDEGFQNGQRRTDRLGWLLMSALLVIALLGGVGPGLLGRSSRSSPQETLRVEYERVEHQQADAAVSLLVSTNDTADLAVELTGPWVQAIDVRGVSPEAAQQLSTPEGLSLVFGVGRAGVQRITLSYRAQRIGLLAGEVSVGGESVSFHQLVMP